MHPCDLLEQQVPLIERAVASVCRRRRVFDEEAEDVRQEVLLKLAADDCAALGRFRGESSLETWITTIAVHRCDDEIRQRRGRWRPSVSARRLGFPAICLEMCVGRDGLEYEEAVAKLLAEGVVRSRQELDGLWMQLPQRPGRVFVPTEDVPEPASDDDPERTARERERDEHARRLEQALHEILGQPPAEDRLILKRLYLDGRTIAQVARELGLEQRPLYRRRDRLLDFLRRELMARGLRWPDGDRPAEGGEGSMAGTRPAREPTARDRKNFDA
ncbi:MAG: sigma-70 family RNA polymerase sigma factor [Candidatus Rokuibacteriota bacterium]